MTSKPSGTTGRWPAAAADITWLSLDIDGVLTDGRIYHGTDGEALKVFFAQDGQSLKFWIVQGHKVVIVSGRDSPIIERRMTELGITHLLLGVEDKLEAIRKFCDRQDVDIKTLAHVGDDLPDIPLMRHAGLGLAPADAHPEVLLAADRIMTTRGGRGVVRDVIQALLEKQGRWEEIMKTLHSPT